MYNKAKVCTYMAGNAAAVKAGSSVVVTWLGKGACGGRVGIKCVLAVKTTIRCRRGSSNDRHKKFVALWRTRVARVRANDGARRRRDGGVVHCVLG